MEGMLVMFGRVAPVQCNRAIYTAVYSEDCEQGNLIVDLNHCSPITHSSGAISSRRH